MPFSTLWAEICPIVLKQTVVPDELKCFRLIIIGLLGLPGSLLPCPVAAGVRGLLLRALPQRMEARGIVRIPVHAMILKSESDLLACFVKLLDSHFLPPEHRCYVVDFQVVIHVIYPIHPLIGRWIVQWATLFYVGAALDIIEQIQIKISHIMTSINLLNRPLARIPGYFQVGMIYPQMSCERDYPPAVIVASHENDACDARILPYKHVERSLVKGQAGILPEIRRMAARAPVGTASYVDSKGDLLRDLPEYYLGVEVF